MGIAERKKLEKSARIKLILDAAAFLFRRKGFAHTTIEDIAGRAEIAKATIYLYFKSKADLYFCLTQHTLEELSRNLKKILENKQDEPEDKIRKFLRAVYEIYKKDPDAYDLVVRYKESEYAKLLPGDRLKILREVMRSNLRVCEQAFEEGVEKGIFRKAVPYTAAVVVWSSFIGIIQFQENRMMPGKRDHRESTLEQFAEFIIEGMKKR